MLSLKNFFNPGQVKNNAAAFAELPGNDSIKPSKTKPIDMLETLADSAATRDGKYTAAPKATLSSTQKNAAAKANVAAFNALPTQAAVTLPKAQKLSVEDILADSAKVRDGYLAGPSLGSKAMTFFGKVASGMGAMISAAVGFFVAMGKSIISALGAPFRKAADAKANKAAFAELPSSEMVVPAKVKQISVDEVLADSIALRTELSSKTSSKPVAPALVPSSAKENVKTLAALPTEAVEPAKTGKSDSYKQMVAANNKAFRKLQASKVVPQVKIEEKLEDVKINVISVVPSVEDISALNLGPVIA